MLSLTAACSLRPGAGRFSFWALVSVVPLDFPRGSVARCAAAAQWGRGGARLATAVLPYFFWLSVEGGPAYCPKLVRELVEMRAPFLDH